MSSKTTGIKAHLAQLTMGVGTSPAAVKPPPVRSAPGDMMVFSSEFKRIDTELKESRSKEGKPLSLDLNLIDPSPWQSRTVTKEQIDEMAEHLKSNPQTTPVTVRAKPDGRYELISGHRRTAALKQLGRATVDAVLVTMSDSQAEMSVFFDNLLAPSLSDYEKYLGFVSVQNRLQEEQGGKALTQDDLAEKAGISRQLVGYILSFRALPPAAHDILKNQPHLIGAKLAAALSQHSKTAPEKVCEAINKIASKEMTASQAMDWLNEKKAPERIEPLVIRSGRNKFADITRRNGQVTIRLKNAALAEEIEEAVAEVLRKFAKTDE